MPSKKSIKSRGRKADRVVKKWHPDHTPVLLPDGTQDVYRYPPHEPKPVLPDTTTLGRLIWEWQLSAAFLNLSPSTQISYVNSMRFLKSIEHVPLAEVKRNALLKIRDRIARTKPGTAKAFCGACYALFAHARRYEELAMSPAWNLTEGLSASNEHPPWTWDEVELALRYLPEELRRAVLLLLTTGQRIGDVCKMTWGDYDGRTIRVKQQKTGAKLLLPVPPQLQTELDEWRKGGISSKVVELRPRSMDADVPILVNNKGKAWYSQTLCNALGIHLYNVPGFPRRANGTRRAAKTAHGLRYLAAITLAEGGCSSSEIRAITGHRSLQMVEKYTRGVEQARLAESAFAKRAVYLVKMSQRT